MREEKLREITEREQHAKKVGDWEKEQQGKRERMLEE